MSIHETLPASALPISVLDQLETDFSSQPGLRLLNEQDVHSLYQMEFESWDRKIIVLDDDPTGVQTVHHIPVYTDWTIESLTEGLNGPETMFFVLTNSRSFSEEETKRQHRLFAERVTTAAKDTEKKFLIISRGDSTLRGHYPLELEVLKDTLEEQGMPVFDGQIICPYFREGGRYTIHGVHYVKEDQLLVPAGETEFARDSTFGYRSSHLGEYVEEKSQGRYRKEGCVYITIGHLRQQRFDEITELLSRVHDFQPVIVDAVCQMDVEVFSICLLRAIKAGKQFLIRSAAAIPKVLGNVDSRPLLTKKDLVPEDTEPGYGGIVLIGSHVKKTTAQLEALQASQVPAVYLEFNVNSCLRETGGKSSGLEEETYRVIAEAESAMAQGKTAVVYTSRTLLAPEHVSKEDLLKLSVQISDAVTAVIGGLHRKPSFLIAKGGITSSDVGTKALKVKKAMVLGQVKPGIPVWKTGEESKFPGLSYIIFPGNVGETDTLKQIVEILAG